jgi:hypothetical protein
MRAQPFAHICGRTREVCSPGVAHWEAIAISDRRLITDRLLKSLRPAAKSTRSEIWEAASQVSACASLIAKTATATARQGRKDHLPTLRTLLT